MPKFSSLLLQEINQRLRFINLFRLNGYFCYTLILMKVSKRKFREIALQMLYGIDISNSEPSDSLSIVKEQLKLPASTVREITAWVELVKEKAEHLDREIDRVSEIENIGPIERNILLEKG